MTSLYFAGVPLFVDSLAVVSGYGTQWSALLQSFDTNYTYELTARTLSRASLFVLLFNVLICLTILGSRARTRRHPAQAPHPDSPPRGLILLCFFFGWLGLLAFIHLYGFDWSQAGFGYANRVGGKGGILVGAYHVLLALSAVGVFYATKRRKWVLLFFLLVPAGAIAFLTGERPHLVPHLACAAYGFMYARPCQNSLERLFRAAVAGVLAIWLLTGVRTGIRDSGFLIGSTPYPAHRDSSSDMLYYCLSDRGAYNDSGTGFRGVRQLVLTGFTPRSVFGSHGERVDVTEYLAQLRFNWKHGSLHPTLYGWFFIDMKWYGVLVAIPLALIMILMESLSVQRPLLRTIYLAGFAMLIVVAMRGSVQFAYARTIYCLVAGSALYLALMRHQRMLVSKATAFTCN
ncbi:MAG: hypothetical protein HQ582_32520 [Planctomycetes bacterium]|nr:hypothetical protein [Planctomycetota bacterium]